MDYALLLAQLSTESDLLIRRRHETETELRRLAVLVRSTLPMLGLQDQARAEQLLDRIDDRSPGLTSLIRLALADGEWQSTNQIRDFLLQAGWFAAYKSNPLASIHTTLRRLSPDTIETKSVKGRTVFRLRRGEPLARARAGAARLQAIRDARDESTNSPESKHDQR